MLEPDTGKILAMVSKPDFDPGSVAENWESLNTNEEAVLFKPCYPGTLCAGFNI